MPGETLSYARIDAKQSAQRIEEIIRLGRPVIEGSNLVSEGRSLGSQDVLVTRRLMETVNPIDVNTAGLYQHLQLTAKVARRLGEALQQVDPKYGSLNLDELEILGLLHDSGRFVTHRFLRNEKLERNMLRRLGVREDLVKKIPSVEMYVGKDPGNQEQVEMTLAGMGVEQKIIEMADLYGKRKDDGGIMSFEEVMRYHRESRENYEKRTGLKDVFPSEKKRTPDLIDFSAEVYHRLHEWFEAEGVDLEGIRQGILDDEATSPIKAVIFDVGNVLVPNPDPDTLRDIETAFGITSKTANAGWKQFIPPLQTGKITEVAFWIEFSKKVGKDTPVGFERLLTSNLATARDPKVDTIIAKLKARGFILAIHSDTIPPHAQAFQESGIYEGFDTVVLSPDIKVKKNDRIAFTIGALRLWLPPQACLFIDDEGEYVQEAKRIGMKGIQFTSADQLEGALISQGISLH